MLRAMLAAALLCAAGAIAHAAASPTDDEVTACTPDAKKFCKPQLSGAFVSVRVYLCPGSHCKELSPKCDAVFGAH